MLRSNDRLPGSIKARGDSFQLDISTNGKRVRRSYPSEAAAVAAQVALSGTIPSEEVQAIGPTVGEVAETYLRTLQQRRCRKSTQGTAYRTRMTLRRLFGEDRVVASLNSQDVADYCLAREAEGVKAITISKELRYFRSALNAAGIPHPCKLAGPRVTLRKAQRLRPAEVEALLAAAPARLRALLVVALTTGMRNSELRHLTWGDIDLEAGTWEVTAKADWAPKSSAGARGPLPLAPPALEELRQLHARTRWKRQEHPVFLRTERRKHPVPWEQAALCRAVKQVYRDAGVTRVSGLHVMRSTYASELLDQGFGIHTLQELLGHSTPQVLLTHYASSSAAQREAAALAIGGLVSSR